MKHDKIETAALYLFTVGLWTLTLICLLEGFCRGI